MRKLKQFIPKLSQISVNRAGHRQVVGEVSLQAYIYISPVIRGRAMKTGLQGLATRLEHWSH